MKKLLLLSFAILFIAKIDAQTYYTSSNSTPVSFGMTSTLSVPVGDSVYIQNIPASVYSGNSANVNACSSVYLVPPGTSSCQNIGYSMETTADFKFKVVTYPFTINGITQYNISSAEGSSNLVFFVAAEGVGIKENYLNKINFSVYPNPASNAITVELPKSDAYKIKLTNVLGSVCKEISFANQKTEMDLSQINACIYFLQVFENESLVAVQKIVRE